MPEEENIYLWNIDSAKLLKAFNPNCRWVATAGVVKNKYLTWISENVVIQVGSLFKSDKSDIRVLRTGLNYFCGKAYDYY